MTWTQTRESGRWRSWLVLVALLVEVGCARGPVTLKTPNLDLPVNYVLIGDELPSDWRLCVPWRAGGLERQLRCMRIADFRAWMRRTEQAHRREDTPCDD